MRTSVRVARHVYDSSWLKFLDSAELSSYIPRPPKNQMNADERYASVDWTKNAHEIARELGISHTAVLKYGQRHGFLKKGTK